MLFSKRVFESGSKVLAIGFVLANVSCATRTQSSNSTAPYPPERTPLKEVEKNTAIIVFKGISTFEANTPELSKLDIKEKCFRVGNAFGSLYFALQVEDLDWKKIEADVNRYLAIEKLPLVANYWEMITRIVAGSGNCYFDK